MKKSLKLISFMLTLCMILTFAGAISVSAETVGVRRMFDMEPGCGSTFEMVNSALNKTSDYPFAMKSGDTSTAHFTASDWTEDKSGNNSLGIDGSGAYSFKVNNDKKIKKFMGLINQSDRSNGTATTTDGYTYFRSAMMRLNPEYEGATVNELTLWNYHYSNEATGFASAAENFNDLHLKYKADYSNAIYNKSLAGSNWTNASTNTITYSVNDKGWTRVTEAALAKNTKSVTNDVTGWIIGMPDLMSKGIAWATEYQSGTWELLVDDYVELVVPSVNIRSQAYPVVYGADLSYDGNVTSGSVLTASYEDAYEVNAKLPDPAVKYQWQNSADGNTWSDISGAASASYSVTADDMGKMVRVKITAESTTYEGSETEYTASGTVTSRPSYSRAVSVPAATKLAIKTEAQASDYSGNYALYVYTALNDYTTSVDGKCGILIWQGNASAKETADVVTLPAYASQNDADAGIALSAAPGSAYVVKVFGEEITTGETYSVQSYVGDELGEIVTYPAE